MNKFNLIKNISQNKFYNGFLILVLLVLLTNQFFGLYFDEFEVLVNQILIEINHYGTKNILATDDNFLNYPLKTWIQKQFPSYYTYGIILLLCTAISYVVFFYLILKNRNSVINIFLVIILYTLSIDHFIFLSNSKLAVTLAIAGILFLNSTEIDNKKRLFVFYLLIFIGLFSRLNYPIIVLFIAFIYAILFQNKYLIKHLLIAFILSSTVFMLYVYLVQIDFDGLRAYRDFEKWIYHRKDFILQNNQIDLQHLSKENLMIYARGMFLLDFPTLNQIHYADIVHHHSIYDYLFKNPSILNIFLEKLDAVSRVIQNEFGPLFFSFIFSILLLNYKAYLEKKLLASIATTLVYFALFLGVHILAEAHSRFLSSYLISPTIIAIYILSVKSSNFNKKIFYASFIAYSILSIYYVSHTIPKNVHQKKLLEARADKVVTSFEEDIQNGITPILGYLDYKGIIPSKLFKIHTDSKWIHFDNGTLNQHPHYSTLNERYFKENYLSMPERMRMVCNTSGYIYSMDYMMQFYQAYLSKVHNYHFEYRIDKSFGDGSYNKYRIEEITEK